MALWFAVMNVWMTPSPRSYGIGTPGVQRSMLKLFHEADRFTSALDPSLDGIEYWFDRDAHKQRQRVRGYVVWRQRLLHGQRSAGRRIRPDEDGAA